MKIRISTLKLVALNFAILYILNKALFDTFLGGLGKGVYYLVVFVGGILGIAKILKKKSKLRRATIWFLIYMLIITINGLIISTTDQRSVGYIEYLSYPLTFFAAYYLWNNTREKQKTFQIITFWGAITSILALFEYITQSPILSTSTTRIYTYYDGTSSYRSVVFCGSPMLLCVLLGVAFILSVYFYHFKGDKKYFIFAVLDVLGMFATGSRAPLLCAILAIAVMYYFLFKDGLAKKNTYILYIFAFFAGIVLTILFIAFPNIQIGVPFIDTIISRFSSTFNFTTEWGNVERLARWTYYLQKFAEHPIAGIGIASTSASVASNVNVTSHGITTESGVIARLVESGLLGTITYYCFVGNLISYSLKGKNHKPKKEISLDLYFVVGIIILILLEDFVLQISLEIFTTFIFWLDIAYGVNLQNNSRDKRGYDR